MNGQPIDVSALHGVAFGGRGQQDVGASVVGCVYPVDGQIGDHHIGDNFVGHVAE